MFQEGLFKMSEQEFREFSRWLEQRNVRHDCPMCGGGQLSAEDHLHAFRLGRDLHGNRGLLLAYVECAGCHFRAPFNVTDLLE